MDVFESTYRPHRSHGPHRAGARSCGEAAPTGAAQSTQQRSGAPRRAGCGQEQQAGGLGLVDAERQRLPRGAQRWVEAGLRLLEDVSKRVGENAKVPGAAVDALPANTADPCGDCAHGIQPGRQQWEGAVWQQRLRRHFISGRGRVPMAGGGVGMCHATSEAAPVDRPNRKAVCGRNGMQLDQGRPEDSHRRDFPHSDDTTTANRPRHGNTSALVHVQRRPRNIADIHMRICSAGQRVRWRRVANA